MGCSLEACSRGLPDRASFSHREKVAEGPDRDLQDQKTLTRPFGAPSPDGRGKAVQAG